MSAWTAVYHVFVKHDQRITQPMRRCDKLFVFEDPIQYHQPYLFFWGGTAQRPFSIGMMNWF